MMWWVGLIGALFCTWIGGFFAGVSVTRRASDLAIPRRVRWMALGAAVATGAVLDIMLRYQ